MDARCTSPITNSAPPKAHSMLGWALYRCGLVLGGLAWVFVASTLCGCNAANGWVMNRSGQSYYDRGDYTAARHEFERALMDSPQNPHYAYNVGKTMEQEGDMQGAEQMYQHALNIDPSHQPSYHALSAMLVDEGRTDDAKALLSSWAETQPYLPESQLAMSEMYETEGNYLAAQQYTQRALGMNPNNPKAMARMARIYERSGNPQLADQWYQQSLTMNPYQTNTRAQARAMRYPGRSPALQMANTIPRMDPSFSGGFDYTNQPGMQPSTMMSQPMQMGSPMVSQYPMNSQYQTSSPGWMPTGSMPQGMMQQGTIMQGAMMPQYEMQTGSQVQMNPQMMGQQFSTESVYESAPEHSPSMPAAQPVQLGQPQPVSHMFPTDISQFGQNPMLTAVPAVKAF